MVSNNKNYLEKIYGYNSSSSGNLKKSFLQNCFLSNVTQLVLPLAKLTMAFWSSGAPQHNSSFLEKKKWAMGSSHPCLTHGSTYPHSQITPKVEKSDIPTEDLWKFFFNNHQLCLVITDLLSCRQVLNIMVLLGFMFNYMLRVNLTIAIVAMVATPNTTNITALDSGQNGTLQDTSSEPLVNIIKFSWCRFRHL